jgi:hypothetical protein
MKAMQPGCSHLDQIRPVAPRTLFPAMMLISAHAPILWICRRRALCGLASGATFIPAPQTSDISQDPKVSV